MNQGDESRSILAPYRGLSSRELARRIFEADVPETVIRGLPAQSLYFVILHNGLDSSMELLETATIEQCQLLLDFDLWERDGLREDALWSWLAVTDNGNSLEFLQKLVKCIDLKLIAMLIGKYADVKIFEESTDNPPGPGYHTPDRGHTWVGITVESADKHFLLARLLALLYETKPELYYQLLSVPMVSTESILLEEAFQERLKRMSSEGVPLLEEAAALHVPLPTVELKQLISTGDSKTPAIDIRPIEPLIYHSRVQDFLGRLLLELKERDAFEAELTYLMNCAVVFFGVDFSDQDVVYGLAEKVKGAINIGIQKALSNGAPSLLGAYDSLGVSGFYRAGWTELRSLRQQALKSSEEQLQRLSREDQPAFALIANLRERFPGMPQYLNDDGTLEGTPEALPSGSRAISSIGAISTIRKILDTLAA